MNRSWVELFGAYLALTSVAGTGLGLLIWLGDIQGEGELNSTYAMVRTTADWMVKLAIGAIVGFSTGRFIASAGRGGAEGERT